MPRSSLHRHQPCRRRCFIAAARKAGARLVVYGGIRKMSTLVQWGEIQLLDLEAEKLLMRRTVTFRGDNDAAYRHAANFVSIAEGNHAQAVRGS